MSSPLYPRTKAKQQSNIAIQENELSIMSVPRRFRNKSPIDTEKEVDTYSTRKQVEDDIAQEVFERDSSYDDVAVASLIKTTQDFEKEINLGRIRELTDQLEISKIMEKQLKEENKASKQDNTRLVKANERFNEEIGRLKQKNDLLSKQAFKWLKEKNMQQAKYEKKKVKATLFREGHDSGLDCLVRAAQQEASTGTASTTGKIRSKRNKQAWGYA